MVAELRSPRFDPLVELYGNWTTEFAERYLPIPGASASKYECVDGFLIMSPRENSGNSFAAGELYTHLREPARVAGCRAYLTVNMQLSPDTWIEPDVTVLRAPVKLRTWIPADQVLMPIEIVSPSSRKRDRVDKPALCAKAGVPFFMRVEITKDDALVELLQLSVGRFVPLARGAAGSTFHTEVPFPISFDPAMLLES